MAILDRRSFVQLALAMGAAVAWGDALAMPSHSAWENLCAPLFLGQSADDAKPQPTINMLLRHSARSCLEYQKTGDLEKARAAPNPAISPHLSFVDMGALLRHCFAHPARCLKPNFCIPRPLERAPGEDGGPIAYRVRHRAKLWRSGAQALTGDC